MVKTTITIPLSLLHEAEGHIVTVELNSGELYRGQIRDAEDNMNVMLINVTCIARNGEPTKLQTCYIRGSKIRFIVLPDMLKNAPMFKRIDPRNKAQNDAMGVGRGASKQFAPAPSGPPRGRR